MILRLFSLRDLKAGAFMAPFCFAADGVALRAVKDMLDESGSQVGKHAADYQVFCIGLFDQDTGAIDGFPKPEFIIECSSLMEMK